MDAARPKRTCSAALWLLFPLLALTSAAGCNGCRPSPLVNRDEKAPDIDELEKKKKEKEKPKEDFEFKPMQVIPGDLEDSRSFVKPGHWVTTRHFIKANNFDFQADLYTKATDSTGESLEVENTPFLLAAARPAALPKGQDKVFETTYFVPVVKQTEDLMLKSVWLQRELRAARGGRLVKEDVRHGTVAMPLYQYHFLVLADEPSRYGYLQSLNSFAAPTSTEVDTDKLNYYRVQAPKIDRYAPLPNHLLTWTTIAYVLWDDLSPHVLTPAQQQALVDWLHFGGQLIISGPSSLEKLRGSYLEPFLPARPGATEEVSESALAELNAGWSLTDRKSGEKKTLNVLPGKPLLSVQLTAAEDATAVPNTGNLVIERRVGIGRVVVTAFALSDSRFLNWGSIDSFVNGAILRRPRRVFATQEYVPDTIFADFHPSLAKDSRLTSTVRFFSRDIGVFSATSGGQRVESSPEDDLPPNFASPAAAMATVAGALPGRGRMPIPGVNEPGRPTLSDVHPDVDDWHLRGFWSGWRTSMAAWNDRSGVSNAARQSLKDAAGISIPKGEFVFKVLAVYLAVLAPLNWLVFKLMGRVEWAWISAPVIAIIGAFAVVRLAQLDIGFARSLTEVAIVEAHQGYPRAHATRYSALYTSLSTSYDLEFADEGSLAMPFAAAKYTRGLHDSVYTVTLRRDRQQRLSGFLVPSNQTGTMHCEQVMDLGGAFALENNGTLEWLLKNNSRFALRDAGVLRKSDSGVIEAAWIGDLPAKTSVRVHFSPARNNRPHFSQWDTSSEMLSYDVQAQELLGRLDKNADGRISRQESRSDPRIASEFNRIDQLDANGGDRMWTRDEIVRWCRTERAGAVSLGQLMELATQALRLLPGETRLIGWTAEELPGITIRPAASQEMRRTLFLVHLRTGRLPEPLPDVNLLTDIAEIKPETPEDGSPTSPGPGGLTPSPPVPNSQVPSTQKSTQYPVLSTRPLSLTLRSLLCGSHD